MPHVVHGAYVDDGLAGDHLGVEGVSLYTFRPARSCRLITLFYDPET